MDILEISRVAFALLFVLGLIMGGTWAIRRYAPQSMGLNTSGRKRLRVQDTLMLDSRHKAVLLGRDNVAHLVVLGPSGSVVVETNVVGTETATVTTKEQS